jgi:hypothetical protein
MDSFEKFYVLSIQIHFIKPMGLWQVNFYWAHSWISITT